jgi:single-stranded-DNA-specific exonuclease
MFVNKKRIEMPIPRIENRITDELVNKKARFAGISPIHSKIIANRNIPDYVEPKDVYSPNLSGLDVYKIKDMKKAADRISDAIINKETIGLLCDFDVDGISSAAVLYSAFTDYFNCEPQYIKVLISNRMKAGYGFSANVLDRIYDSGDVPTLLITADQGSKDDERVTSFKKRQSESGLVGDTIVTDHHHIDGKGPKDAYAVVNPQRFDDESKDKTICGCTVALLVMVATRDSLIEKGYLEETSPKLTDLLTYSTAATIADCVSMASPLNRAIVVRGLQDINNGTKAPWRIMRKLFSDEKQPLRTDSIGFGLGPRINACSRTGGDGLVALKFYLAETDMEAERFLSLLDHQNDERKKIEQKLVENAVVHASELYKKGYKSLVIYLEDGHHGIHGIAASRICERFGRPVIIISPKEYEEYDEKVEVKDNKGIIKTKKIKKKNVFTVSGSARSIESVDIHHCMENVSKKHPNLFLGFGGHSMAAGMGLKLENIDALREGIEEEVSKVVGDTELYPVIKVDGELKPSFIIDFDFLDKIIALEPYGNGFEYPIFKITCQINDIKIVGKNKDTGKVKLTFGQYSYDAIWFKYTQSVMYQRIQNGDTCEMAISIGENFFKGKRKISIQVVHANPIM